MSEKLDEQGLQFARDAVKSAAAYNPMGDISTVADVAIRAYLQTAAADVSGLVKMLHEVGGFIQKEHGRVAAASSVAIEAASTLQTLSASNAALEAENAKLRDAIDYYEIGCTAVGVPHAGERKVLHDCIAAARSILAALSAPKGGQDHG